MPRLRRLDGHLVSEAEHKAATMFPHITHKRNSDQKLALADHLTRRLSLQTGADEGLFNCLATNEGQGNNLKDLTGQRNCTQKQKNAKWIPGSYPSKYDKESKLLHTGETSRQITTSSNVNDRPKESFGPVGEKYRSLSAEQKNGFRMQTRHIAKGYYTPNPNQSLHSNSLLVNNQPPSPFHGLRLSYPSNPILHPLRPTYCTVNQPKGGSSIPQQAGMRKRDGYRKPLEILLDLVDKHWTGQRSLHHHNNFLSQAVHILSMMEKYISTRESEVKTLRGKVDTLNFRASAQTEEHQTEVRNLSAQLQEARSEVFSLSEQLKIVLEENVSLQKQLLKTERRYLKSMMRSSPIAQIEEAKAEVEELRKEIEELRERVEEAEKFQGPSNLQHGIHRSPSF